MIKYLIPNQAKITHHSGEKIEFEALAGQAGVTDDGVLITPETIRGSSRWMLGRPVTMGAVGSPAGASRAIGQVDAVEILDSGQMKVTGSLWPQKLSSEQLQALDNADRPLKAQAGFFLMATQESGTWEGKCYKEKARDIQYDHMSLVLPELKGHSAPTREDRLKEIERSWEARLGRKC